MIKATDNLNGRGIIISLCDLSGKMVEPWVRAGYEAVLIDPQHAPGVTRCGSITRIGAVIVDALEHIGPIVRSGRVVFVAGFPPCTDVAVSGARWWEGKRKADPYFQAKAAIVAEQCRIIGAMSGAPWVFENPVSAFGMIFGRAQHTFNPHDFTGLCANDNYTKKTCLWVGGGFSMPSPERDASLGEPDNRIHFCSPSADRSNIRSATPSGFAEAVYRANAPHLKREAQYAPGPCAKRIVTATIVTINGARYVGTNHCHKPQPVCPRGDAPTGVGYELCKSVCEQVGHAEVNALRLAGSMAKGGTLYLEGHDYACGACKSAATEAGIAGIVFGKPPH